MIGRKIVAAFKAALREIFYSKTEYTVTLEENTKRALASLKWPVGNSDIPKFIEDAVRNRIDLLRAQDRNLTLILRDNQTGKELEYDPNRLGKARSFDESEHEPLPSEPVELSRWRPPDGSQPN